MKYIVYCIILKKSWILSVVLILGKKKCLQSVVPSACKTKMLQIIYKVDWFFESVRHVCKYHLITLMQCRE